MIKKLALVALLVVAGCGGGGSEPAPSSPLQGTWYVDIDSACGFGMTFSGNTYATQLLCSLASGGYADEIEAGTFASDGTHMTMTALKTSCPHNLVAKVSTFGYGFSGSQLVVTATNGSIVFAKAPMPMGETAIIKYGCIDSGVFTAGEIVAVP